MNSKSELACQLYYTGTLEVSEVGEEKCEDLRLLFLIFIVIN